MTAETAAATTEAAPAAAGSRRCPGQRLYLTKSGWSFVALSALIYVSSLQADSGLLFLLLGVLFGCFVINAFTAWHGVRAIEVVPPPYSSAAEGESVRGSWCLINSGAGAVGLLELRSQWGPLFQVGAIGAGETMHLTPKLRMPARGIYPLRRLRLSSSYPFGLLRSTRPLQVSGEIVVYPAVYACAEATASGFEPMLGGRFSGRHRGPSGDHFHGVRPLRPEDPVKLIHWRSSARGHGIMVKEFDEELSGRLGFILDMRIGDLSRARARNRLDALARATGSLVLAALDAGHQVEITSTYDPETLSLTPFADSDLVMRYLARLEAPRGALPADATAAAVQRLPQRAGLCVLAATSSPEQISWLAQLSRERRRPLTVCLPLQEPTSGLPSEVSLRYYGDRHLVAAP